MAASGPMGWGVQPEEDRASSSYASLIGPMGSPSGEWPRENLQPLFFMSILGNGFTVW